MSIPQQAQAERLSSGGMAFRFPYSADLIEALKAEVPARHRSYDPTSKAWAVTEPNLAEQALALAAWFFPDVVVLDGPQATRDPRPLRRGDPAFQDLHLLPSAPPELIAAAYRTLSRLHHPDLGGSNAAMQRLNAALDALKARGAA